jgi:hypothetical protein
MTFQEYLNQEDPKRMPNVVLEMEDLYIVYTLNSKSGKVHMIQLHIHGDLHEYRLDEGDTQLWAMDEHGNKKARSCFSINDFKESTKSPNKYTDE